MALFSKEPDNTKFRETVKPATPSISPAAAREDQTIRYEEVRPPLRTPGPAVQGAGPSAYLDKGSKISGKLFFEGPVKIDGQVDGEISANDVVVISETAVITSQLKAASVVIAGKINGDVSAAKRIEVRPTAKVFANLTTPILVVHDGALFEGHCTMNPEAKEDRKVPPLVLREDRVIPQAAADGNKQA